MQELRFISSDDDGLIVSDEGGEHYRLVIDDALRDALRPRPHVRSEAPKVAPREIQQLIRAGRSAAQVVELTGADADDVARFEGPVMAERAHVVEQARLVTVRVHPDLDPLDAEPANFGSVIDERLEALGASGVRWDAWKDPEQGWRVGLDFTVDGIDRDALWAFDLRSHALSPQNAAAITLSQQGELASLQAPRLRAVDPVHMTGAPLGQVRDDHLETADAGDDTPSSARPAGDGRSSSDANVPPRASDPRGASWLGAAVAEIGQRSDAPRDETADLLEQLRRRRGEREPHGFDDLDDLDVDDDHGALPAHGDDAPATPVTPFAAHGRNRSVAQHPSSPSDAREPDDQSDSHGNEAASSPRRGGMHAVDVPLAGLESPGDDARVASPRGSTGPVSRRRGRPTLPSWDEIVFGTRSDDDRD